MDKIKWHCLPFESLSLMQWHDLLELRINVFVVEQNCPYPEIDQKDPKCHHIFAELNGDIVAVARIVAPGVSYAEVSIGRVATSLNNRKKGLGIELMEQTLKSVAQIYGDVAIRISAQTYLKKFYSDLGFIPTGKEYLEDGIPHLEMLKTPISNATNK
jgi:ElaA protein